MTEIPEDLQNAIRFLKEGKVILYPTDTIWGIGCSAQFPMAVHRIFEIKQRPPEKSLILLVDSIQMLKKYVQNIHPRVETLMSYHNRPLTIIYPNAKNLDPAILSKDGSIAIRLCLDPFCQALIQGIDAPLISTSANISQFPTPANFKDIQNEIIIAVDYVVKHRQSALEPGEPSMIITYDTEGELIFIRN
ncbi:MAG: threonylcarbamoyl-AMP synthase [Saprospiraceae bacterium]|nr:threonylcarbamoyl-AMP synthase [Saprospiraceae bacterium]